METMEIKMLKTWTDNGIKYIKDYTYTIPFVLAQKLITEGIGESLLATEPPSTAITVSSDLVEAPEPVIKKEPVKTFGYKAKKTTFTKEKKQ